MAQLNTFARRRLLVSEFTLKGLVMLHQIAAFLLVVFIFASAVWSWVRAYWWQNEAAGMRELADARRTEREEAWEAWRKAFNELQELKAKLAGLSKLILLAFIASAAGCHCC